MHVTEETTWINAEDNGKGVTTLTLRPDGSFKLGYRWPGLGKDAGGDYELSGDKVAWRTLFDDAVTTAHCMVLR